MNPCAPIYGLSIKSAHIWQLWPAWHTEIRPHQYDFFNLWYIWRGRGQLIADGQKWELRTGLCAHLRPWGHYWASHDPAHPIGYIRIDLNFLDAQGVPYAPAEADLPPVVQSVPDAALAEAVLRTVVHAHADGSAEARELAAAYLHAFHLHLRHQAARPASLAIRDRLQPALQAIQQQSQRQFRVRELARLVHLSVNQFTRLFKIAMNMTPSQYLIQQRLHKAQQMLESSGMRVSEIADLLGYPDVFAFSRQFHQKTGTSPRRWRSDRTSGLR